MEKHQDQYDNLPPKDASGTLDRRHKTWANLKESMLSSPRQDTEHDTIRFTEGVTSKLTLKFSKRTRIEILFSFEKLL